MKVALLCPGLGRAFRGYERFASELFEAAKGSMDVTLFRGGGSESSGEVLVGGLPRGSLAAKALGTLAYDTYFWEALSFAVLVRNRLRSFDVLHYSEPPLNLAFRRFGPHTPRRLFSHALNMGAGHTLRCHHIHQTSPEALDAARNLGVPEERMTLLPYGIWTGRFKPDRQPDVRTSTRKKYGLPLNEPVLMCVAAVNRTHKRVDHLVAEVARLDRRPHVLICGAPEDLNLLAEAKATLGERSMTHLYVSNEQILELYGAADLFVLPSLIEGFGLAAVEAQLSGLPVIAHDSAHFRWLLGNGATDLVDMRRSGALTAAVERLLQGLSVAAAEARSARPDQVRRYDWGNILPDYLAMYARTMQHSHELIETLVAH